MQSITDEYEPILIQCWQRRSSTDLPHSNLISLTVLALATVNILSSIDIRHESLQDWMVV